MSSPDITEPLPAPLSSGAQAATYERSGQSVDLAIGGLPFRLAISDDRPAQRETAPIRREQLDTSAQAGEQSLESVYWLRTQTTWHQGSGILFYEPGTEDTTTGRFRDSLNVDVWSPGGLKLLKKTELLASHSGSTARIKTAVVDGENRIVYLYGNQVTQVNDAGTFSATVAVGGASTVARDFTVYGETAWVGGIDGVYKVDLSAGTVTQIYTNGNAAVYYGKARLFGTLGPSVYELVPNNSPAGAFPTPLYTHPLADWQWTAMTEAPSAMLAAGHAGAMSSIYRWSINEAAGGALPELGSPIQVAEFPPGEIVHSVYVYLGGYIAIGTSKGVRIGVVGDDGSLQYGPLTVETSEPVRAFAARDSYIFAAVKNAATGAYGAVRIDLGQELAPLRFAWANDAQTTTTQEPTSLAFLGATERLFLATDGSLWGQSATLYADTGHVDSGRIRFGTTQPKAFRMASAGVRFPDAGGSMTLSTLSPEDGETTLYTYGPSSTDPGDIAIKNTAGEYISVRLNLAASQDGTATPIVDQWTLKAVPTPRRQRLLSYPLLCFDAEEDRYGNIIGAKGSGYAWNRYRDLEALEEKGEVVQVQDFTTGEQYPAQIDIISMRRTTPPQRQHDNFGGVIDVVLRKLS